MDQNRTEEKQNILGGGVDLKVSSSALQC